MRRLLRLRPLAALLLVVGAAGTDTAAHLQRRVQRAVAPLPQLYGLSGGVTAERPGGMPRPASADALEEGHRHAEVLASPPSGAGKAAGPVVRSRRLMIAMLLCVFFGGFGVHHIYLGRNVAALQCLLTFNYFGSGLGVEVRGRDSSP